MNWDGFCANIEELFNITFEKRYWSSVGYEQTDSYIKFIWKPDDEEKKEVVYTRDEFDKDFEKVKYEEKTYIYYEKYCEIPAFIKNKILIYSKKNFEIEEKLFFDKENQINYKIGYPSKEFLVKMLQNKIEPNKHNELFTIMLHFKELVSQNEIEDNFWGIIKLAFDKNITLQIKSEKEYSEETYLNLAKSFVFNLNYNTDIGIRIYEKENLQYQEHLGKHVLKNILEDVPVPRKIYKSEVVEMYNRACISEDFFVKYISFYNILEYFYGDVFNEHMINLVKTELTKPDFTVKNNQVLIRFVKTIEKELKFNKNNSFDERKALELVLEKYICINELKETLMSNNVLYKHYDKNKVTFSDGVALNFNDQPNIVKNLASRIYYTRNSLVHSKSCENSLNEYKRYRPFQDVAELVKEIFLIRTIAEMIIIKTGIQL